MPQNFSSALPKHCSPYGPRLAFIGGWHIPLGVSSALPNTARPTGLAEPSLRDGICYKIFHQPSLDTARPTGFAGTSLSDGICHKIFHQPSLNTAHLTGLADPSCVQDVYRKTSLQTLSPKEGSARPVGRAVPSTVTEKPRKRLLRPMKVQRGRQGELCLGHGTKNLLTDSFAQ